MMPSRKWEHLSLIAIAISGLLLTMTAFVGCAETPPGSPTLTACDGREYVVNNALAEAWKLNEQVVGYMQSGVDKNDSYFRTWFDALGRDKYKESVTQGYGKIKQVLSGPYGVNCSAITETEANGCKASDPQKVRAAWVWEGDHDHVIHTCPDFWTRDPMEGDDSQPATIIHEFSHFKDTAQTMDFGLSPDEAKGWATGAPDDTIKSADNYSYFAAAKPSAGCRVGGRGASGSLACALLALFIARRRRGGDTQGRRCHLVKPILLSLLAAALPACAIASAETAPVVHLPAPSDPLLACHLETPAAIDAGGALPVTMIMHNTTVWPASFLSRGTPFAGGDQTSKVFEVAAGDRRRIPYRGIIAMERGRDTLANYIAIPPGGAVATTVDLSPYFDLSSPGPYTIRFSRPMLSDLVFGRPPDLAHRHIAPLACVPTTVTVTAPIAAGTP